MRIKYIAITFLLTLSFIYAHAQLPYVLDMVHHNTGEANFVTTYGKPEVIKSLGMNGKVYFLSESAVLGINWQSFDPDVFPLGSKERIWVEEKAIELNKKYNEAKSAGLQVYCMSDLLLFPKRLVNKYGMQTSFEDITDSLTQQMLREEIRLVFNDFPQLDGIVVRIGETYTADAPYHVGGIFNRTSKTTIIPLMQLLREEVCVKLNKKLIFRTWMSFDSDLDKYNAISDAIEPHDNLIISVKYCEGDFHRGNRFSRILGAGRHRQIVEVQCAREYEGKGAFPNYIANGVINGFEEYQNIMPASAIKGLKELYQKSPLFSGVWTWSKGGGWDGPYITNEFWNELNAYVLCKWAQAPNRSEEEIFNDYAVNVLGLKGSSINEFRRLAILSAQAVIRGHRSTFSDIDPWWTRDNYIGQPPTLPTDSIALKRVLSEKRESVEIWKQIVDLADSIDLPDSSNKKYLIVSAKYGYLLHEIYDIAFDLKILSNNCINNASIIDSLLIKYNNTWDALKLLKANNSCCASLYSDLAFQKSEKLSLKNYIENIENSVMGRKGVYISKLISEISDNPISLEADPRIGQLIYSDDTCKYSDIPLVVKNAEYIFWGNKYRNVKTGPIISFSALEEGKIYIFHDDRLSTPKWIFEKYVDTGYKCMIQNIKMSIYEAAVKSGDIINCYENGLNSDSIINLQYLVYFKPKLAMSDIQEYQKDIFVSTSKGCINIYNNDSLFVSYQIYNIAGVLVDYGTLTNITTKILLEKGFYIARIKKVKGAPVICKAEIN